VVQASSDNTAVTSDGSQSQCLSLLSSTVGCVRVSLSQVPDDVRLLAESCVQVSSSSSVSNFDKFGISSLAASGQTLWLPPPPPYQSFNISRSTVASLPADVPPNVTPFPSFSANSDRATVPSSVQYPSASFSAVPSPSSAVLPESNFLRSQQYRCPVSLPTELQQPYTFPHARNPVLPGEIQPPDLNCMQPWLLNRSLCSSLHMTPTYSVNNVSVDMAVNNYLHSRSSVLPPWSLLNPLSSNYHNFLPSLRSAFTPNSPGNHFSPQFADYFARKRGGLLQNSTSGLQVNNSSDLMRHIYRTPQFDQTFTTSCDMANQRPPLLVNANETQMRHGIVSQRPSPVKANRVQVRHTRFRQRPHPAVNSSDVQMRHEMASQRPPPPVVSTSIVQVRQQKPPNLFIDSFCSWAAENRDDAKNQKTARRDSVSDTTVHSVSSFLSEKVSSKSAVGCQPSHPFAMSSIPTNLQVTMSHAVSVVTAKSPVATITTNVSDTVNHPTAVMQASATAKSNSMENLTAGSLLFDINSHVTAGSVPNNISSNSSTSQILSNLLSKTVELFPPNADHASDSSQTATATESCTGHQSDANLDNGTSQLDDAFDDLDSLPADVMSENFDSVSLRCLESFCNMLEKSDSACQRSAPISCPATLNGLKNNLENGDQPSKSNSDDVHREYSERQLQFAKSLGKGRHFAEEMQQRRREQAKKRRRRTRLTSLEVTDESNSSDSWHPDSQSESSNYQTPSPCPDPSTESSLSQSSDDFAVVSRRTRQQQLTRKRQKRSFPRKSREKVKIYHHWPHGVTQKCSVMLEQLHMQGRQSVNVCLIDSIICCPQLSVVKPIQRIVSSDSEASTTDMQPTVKFRMRVPRITDIDSC